MKHLITVLDITTFIQNVLLSASIIAGGIWALHKFRRRNEVASLSVKINKTELIKDINNSHYILVEVLVSNLGDREVKIYYNYLTKDKPLKYEEVNSCYQSKIDLYKVAYDETHIPISEKIGLTSSQDPKPKSGRIRSGVSIRFPYIFFVNEPGLYFLEFSIPINMQTYFKPDDDNDKPIKIWSDRLFYNISEYDFKR